MEHGNETREDEFERGFCNGEEKKERERESKLTEKKHVMGHKIV